MEMASSEPRRRPDWLDSLLRVPGIRGAVYRIAESGRRGRLLARAGMDYARLEFGSPEGRPEICAVLVGRNDDYMPDFLGRLRATIQWNLRYLVSEIVFVEWNPPPGRPLLATALAAEFPEVRAYVVPPETHVATCENPRLPLLEYHAKNVGIRRASAPWILVTNGDAAVGLDSVRRILRAPLRQDEVWTAERHDVAWVDERSAGLGRVNIFGRRKIVPYRSLGTGEFALASRDLWHRVRGYDESLVRHRIGCDSRGVAQMVAHGARIRRAGSVLHMQHDTSCTVDAGPHQGEAASIEGVPYSNLEGWGLRDARESPIAERVWELVPGHAKST